MQRFVKIAHACNEVREKQTNHQFNLPIFFKRESVMENGTSGDP